MPATTSRIALRSFVDKVGSTCTNVCPANQPTNKNTYPRRAVVQREQFGSEATGVLVAWAPRVPWSFFFDGNKLESAGTRVVVPPVNKYSRGAMAQQQRV